MQWRVSLSAIRVASSQFPNRVCCGGHSLQSLGTGSAPGVDPTDLINKSTEWQGLLVGGEDDSTEANQPYRWRSAVRHMWINFRHAINCLYTEP